MQGYQQGQGQWPGGYDRGMSMINQRGRADENPPDGRFSEMETDSPTMSMVTHALKTLREMHRSESRKRPVQQGLRGDFSGFPDAKTSRYESGGPPDSTGQGQDNSWRCTKCNSKNIEGRNYCIHCYSSREVGDQPPEGRAKVDEDKARTLYVFDLQPTTTTTDLFRHFFQWGDMMKFHVYNDPDGHSTGSGVVQYIRQEDAQAALAAGPHFIQKKQIIVSDKKKADTRTNERQREMMKAAEDPKTAAARASLESSQNKLFVSNIPTDVTSSELTEHFSMWGKIHSCNIGGNVGPNNNYGFVRYNNEEDALNCLNEPHTLQDRRLFVQVSDKSKHLKKAEKDPREVSAAASCQSKNLPWKNKKCQLFVTNVPVGTTQEEVYDHFVNWGDLDKYIVRPTATNKMIAFVSYVNEVDALQCLDAIHFIKGNRWYVQWSNESKVMQEPPRASDPHKSDVTRDAPARPARSPQDAPAIPARSPWGAPAVPARSPQDAPARPARSAQDAPARPARSAQDALARPARSAQDAPARPARSAQDAPARPARSPQDAPARPARSAQDAPARPARSARPASPVPPIADPPTQRLSISGLTTRTSNDQLLCYFSRWGGIEDYELEKDTTGRPTGCAFVVFGRQCDAETAVSAKPHIIDMKEIKVTYTMPPKRQPSETFPSRREQRHSQTVQRRRLPETVKSQRLHEVRHQQDAVEPQRLPETVKSQRLHEVTNQQDAMEPQRLPEDAKSQRLPDNVLSRRLPETFQSRRVPEDIRQQRLPEWNRPRMLPEDVQARRQSSPEPFVQGLTPADSVSYIPLGTEYDCNVSGCFYRGTSLQFERHWTERHEAKVLYLICSFCSMGCVDTDDLCEHLDFFHGVEDKIEMSQFLQNTKREERDNIHYVMPGNVTKESCMRVAEPSQHEPTRLKAPPQQEKDAKDVHKCTECTFTGTMDESLNHWNKNHASELVCLRCPICPKTFTKKASLEFHIKHVHRNNKMYMEKEPEDLEADLDESQNFNLRSSQHKFQRQEVPRSQTHIQTISGMGSRRTYAGNRSTKTKPTVSSSPPLQSGQNVPRPNLVPRLPTQQPVPRLNPPPLATHVPLTPQQHIQSQPTIVSAPPLSYRHPVHPPTSITTQQAVPLRGLVTPFYRFTASVPNPVPPPLRPSVPFVSTPQPAVASQLYSPAYPQPSVTVIPNTFTQPVSAVSRPVVSAQPHIVPPVSYSQASFQPQVSAQSHHASQQAPIMAPPQPQVGATVTPSAGAPPQLPLTRQVISQPLQHANAPQPVHPPMSKPGVLMKQPPVASKSVNMPSADSSTSALLNPLDLIDFYKGNTKTKEKAREDVLEKSSKQKKSKSEPKKVTDTKASDELKKSVQPESVLALRPDWTKTLKVTRPETSPLDKTNSVKLNSFRLPSRVIPRFKRTNPESIRKFLLWSHIMMERLEDANIKVRKRLEADVGDDNDDEEEPEEMLESSDEETSGGNTEVKETLSQAHEDMKARAQTIGQKVFEDYINQKEEGKTTNTNKQTKTAKNQGQSKKGKGKQGFVDKKVLGQLLRKSIGMVKYQFRRANVDAELVSKGMSWARNEIVKMLEQDEKMILTEVDEESEAADNHGQAGKGLQQRSDNRGQSRENLQQRTDNRGQAGEGLQQRTDNCGRSREELHQRTDNHGRSRIDLQQRTDNRGQAGEGLQQRIDNRGRSREDLQQRTDNRGHSREDLQQRTDNYGRSREDLQQRTDNRGRSREDPWQLTDYRGRSREDLRQKTGNRGQTREDLHQRTDNRGRSREDLRQRIVNRVESRGELQQRTDNHGRSREDLWQSTDNCGQEGEDLQRRTDKRERSREEFQQRTDNHGRSRDKYQQRTENRGRACKEYGNEDEEYALAYVDEDGVRVTDDGFVMGEERMDEETDDVYHGMDQGSRRNRIREESVSHGQRVYGGGGTRSGHRNLDERDLQIHDQGQDEYFEDDRFSEEEYLEYREDDRISSSSGRNSSHSMRRNEDRRSQRFEEQMPRDSFLDERRHFSPLHSRFSEGCEDGYEVDRYQVSDELIDEGHGHFVEDERFVEVDERFVEEDEHFVEDIDEGYVHSERVVEVVNYEVYDDEHEEDFDTVRTKSAQQDSTGRERRLGRGRGFSKQSDGFKTKNSLFRGERGGKGFSNQRDSFKTDNSLTRGGRGQGSIAYGKSSNTDEALRWSEVERKRGQEISKCTEHFREDYVMKKDRKDVVNVGTTKSQKMRSKWIDDEDDHEHLAKDKGTHIKDKNGKFQNRHFMRGKTQGDKANSSKTKGQSLKNKEVTSEQVSRGNNLESKGSDNTEGNEGKQLEQQDDDISEGNLSGDGSICDMDDFDMDDFVIMDAV
ncbi:uncharacterized protein [Haliotis cracherodii]|uniref:uncharacterized protein n=1 Tax=Haliotis cracherodii TaxID=6455 RepID=UPI0039E94DE6